MTRGEGGEGAPGTTGGEDAAATSTGGGGAAAVETALGTFLGRRKAHATRAFAALNINQATTMSKYASSIELLESRIAPAALVVTSVADAGTGTLRDTITGSHAGDVISFAPALMGKVITLTSGEILINHSLTINGPGAGALVISGNNASRIFHIDDGSDSNSTVTLNGLSLVNGKSGSIGGAIDSAENLIITNSVLSGNTSSSNGGALEENNVLGAGLLLENTQIVNNSATGAGGGVRFASGGSFAAIGCFIANNTAGDSGGGLSLVEMPGGTGDLYVVNSTISHNSAPQGGGLAFINYRLGADGKAHTADDGLALLSGSLVTGNTATTVGGGVLFDAGRATVNNSMVKNNAAPQGGGLSTDSATDTLLVTGSSFQQNRATDSTKLGGGALYLNPSAAATATTISGTVITTSEFVGNQTAASGGAIHEDGTALTLNLTSFRQNAAPGGLGGALAATAGGAANPALLAVTNSEFLANAAGNSGGAVYYSGTSPLNFTMVTFTDNSSGGTGGAFTAVSSGAISLHFIAATGNAAGSSGGAFYVNPNTTLDLDFLLLTGNSALGGGGAFTLVTGGNATLHHAVISGNTAKLDGGGGTFFGPQLSIADTEIVDNISGASGGGLKNLGSGTLTLDSATTLIAGNTANDGMQTS